jgi:hypothetical protein
MTKTLRLSLVALALATTSILSIESASAAKLCRGGLILSAKCSNPAYANEPICQCSESRSESRFSAPSPNSGSGTNPDNDPPDDDNDEEPVDQ